MKPIVFCEEFTSISDLFQYLPDDFKRRVKTFIRNDRFHYLDDYLKKIGATSVIIECEYVDRNFIEDYCGHYARCFNDYPKKCHRLHFFSHKISEKHIKERLLLTSNRETDKRSLQESYLGFIVLRPIPQAMLGKVCLKTYPPEEGKNRIFPVLKDYKAHLLGEELIVKSIAYQEQDKVISACATSALWSAFHAVGQKDIEDIHSPFHITENARKVIASSHSSNILDKGLYLPQMASAIKEEGLDPLMLEFRSISYTKALVRAYLNIGLPVILGMTLRYQNETGQANGKLKKFPIGDHAVVIAGYNINTNKIPQFSSDNISSHGLKLDPLFMIASGISKFYVHDDQIGPFASMTSRGEYWQHLETRWNYYKNKEDAIYATPTTLIIPCYKKIRVRFASIWNFTSSINSLLGDFWRTNGYNLVWDIRLTYVNDLKHNVLSNHIHIPKENKLEFLSYQMPRYLWQVDCWISHKEEIESKPVATYLFDATDMPTSDLLVAALNYDPQFYFTCQKSAVLITDGKTEQDLQNLFPDLTLRALLEAYKNDSFTGEILKSYYRE